MESVQRTVYRTTLDSSPGLLRLVLSLTIHWFLGRSKDEHCQFKIVLTELLSQISYLDYLISQSAKNLLNVGHLVKDAGYQCTPSSLVAVKNTRRICKDYIIAALRYSILLFERFQQVLCNQIHIYTHTAVPAGFKKLTHTTLVNK